MSWSKALLLLSGLLVASSAVADPLLHQIQRAGPARVLAEGDLAVTWTPPLGLGAPTTKMLVGSSDLFASSSGSAVADVGLPGQFAGAVAFIDIADLDVTLLGPLESSLLSVGDPSTYSWGGVAPLRIAGNLELLIAIPGQQAIQFASAHFGVETSQGALAGTFAGDATTRWWWVSRT
jgi:hypothetical protein